MRRNDQVRLADLETESLPTVPIQEESFVSFEGRRGNMLLD